MAQLAGSQGSGSLGTLNFNEYMPQRSPENTLKAKDAQAIESKYGNFEFPVIPEHEGVQA